MSSFRDRVVPDSLAGGGHPDADEDFELIVRGRSFRRSPLSAEIEPTLSPQPAPAAHFLALAPGTSPEPDESPFASEMSAQDPEPAGLELQPMLSGMTGDSSAPMADNKPQHTPAYTPLSTVPAADVGWSNSSPAQRSVAADPAGLVSTQREPSVPSVLGKRDWHAAIRQRLKMRVRC
jgi:hypothetical protein